MKHYIAFAMLLIVSLTARPAVLSASEQNNSGSLISAIIDNHVAAAKELLRSGVVFPVRGTWGYTFEGKISKLLETDEEFVGLAVSAGLNLNQKISNQYPIIEALSSESFQRLKLYVELGADVNLQGAFESPLLASESLSDREAYTYLLAQGAKYRESELWKLEDAYFSAGETGDMERLRQLVAAGVLVDTKNYRGSSLLTMAVKNSRFEVFTFLVKSGADVFLEDEHGQNLLMLAALYGHESVVLYLADRGLDLHARNRSGKNALLLANYGMYQSEPEEHGRYLQLIEMLIKKGAEVNSLDDDGKAAITYAVASGNVAVVKLLLTHGANPRSTSSWKKTLILDAHDRGFREIVSILLYHATDLADRGYPEEWSLANAYRPRTDNTPVVVKSGRLLTTPKGDLQQLYDSGIEKITSSPDGRFGLIATYSKIHLMNMETGRVLWQIKVDSGLGKLSRFSQDGQYVLAPSYRIVDLLEVETGNLVRRFSGHIKSIERITISQQGHYLATASEDKSVRIWDMSTGRELHNFLIEGKAYSNELNFQFSPDERYFLLCDEKSKRVWDFKQKQEMWSKVNPSRTQTIFLPDSSFLLTSNRWKFTLNRVDTGEVVCSLGGSGGSIYRMVSSPDSRFLVAGKNIYDLKTALTEQSFETPLAVIENSFDSSVLFSPDSQFILTGIKSLIQDDGKSGAAVLREIATGRETARFKGHTGQITSAAFISGGKVLLTGSNDRTTKLWNVETSQEILPQPKKIPNQEPRLVARTGHSYNISAFALASDDRHILTGGKDRAVILWELATGREIRRFEEHAKAISAVALSPDMQSAASASEDGVVRVFDLKTGQIRHRFMIGSATFVSFRPDSLRLVVGSKSDNKTETSIWDLGSGEKITDHYLYENLKNVTFAADGRMFVGSLGKGTVTIGTVDNDGDFNLAGQQGGHSKFLTSVVLSQSGRIAVTGSFDGNIIVWDVAQKKKLHQFPAEIKKESVDGDINEYTLSAGDLCVAPNDKTFLEYQYDKIRVWDIETGTLLRQKLLDAPDGAGIYSTVKISFTKDGNRFLVASDNGQITVYDFDTLDKSQVVATLGNVGSVSSVAFSSTGDQLLIGSLGSSGRSVAQVWSMRSGEEKQRIKGSFVAGYNPSQGPFADSPQMALDTRAAFLPGGRGILLQNERAARLVDTELNEDLILPQMAGDAVNGMAISPDGRFAVLAVGFEARLWDLVTHSEFAQFAWDYNKLDTGPILTGMAVSNVAVSPDNRLISIASRSSLHPIMLWDVASKKMLFSFGQGFPRAVSLAFSPDGKMLATGHRADHAIRLWEVESGQLIKQINGHADTVVAMQFSSDDGNTLLTGSKDGTARLWNVSSGKELQRFAGDSAEVTSVAFSPDGTHLVTGHSNGNVLFWRTDTERWLAKIISFLDGGWAVIDPDGRYDSNSPGDLPGISWVMPDDPLVPLPVEIFMREYYEPRLLSRVLGQEKFNPITALSDLNRIQPEISITQVAQDTENDQVSVTINIANRLKLITGKDGTPMEQQSGAYDLRLFRDGQLVGYYPDENGKIELDPTTGKRIVTFDDIQLPTQSKKSEVVFSAYAFNVSQVKSATSKHVFSLPKGGEKRKPRAYIIAIGVNAYENRSWDLRYAASDAIAIDSVVKNRLEDTGVFAEVISIPLISDYQPDATGQQVLEGTPVTSALVKAVFDRLSGLKSSNKQLLNAIPNAEKLQPATPDDLLLITYSGHGLADENRQFHLFPYDIGKGSSRVVDEELLSHTISSEDLSLWLRDVDAGELMMVIDACNSAASVEGESFKPGPMGNRGLGQLAYDKGMRILTASQAEAVALESRLIRHGALTYALVREGLEANQSDKEPQDRQITAGEWLRYGVARVPSLYAEILSGEVKPVGRGKVIQLNTDKERTKNASVQQPGLFDFNKAGRETLIFTVRESVH